MHPLSGALPLQYTVYASACYTSFALVAHGTCLRLLAVVLLRGRRTFVPLSAPLGAPLDGFKSRANAFLMA